MDYLKDVVGILCCDGKEKPRKVHAILEDAESPITRKAIEVLYQSIIDKSHVDFDTIPLSKGDIQAYSGYKTMCETLSTIQTLAESGETYADALKHVQVITTAISNIIANKRLYQAGFARKNQLIMTEYNTFVYTTVEATTSILYQFADFLKTPSTNIMRISFRNTKYRADLFFIEQLAGFNNICKTGKYDKYLNGMLDHDKNGPIMEDVALVVGAAALMTVLLSIVPITRRLIHCIQNFRNRLADDLELQAYFLDMNKTYLEANKTRDLKKTKKILEKQEKLRLSFLRMAEKLRVSSLRAEELGRKTLKEEDRTMSLNNIQDQASNGAISIL